LFDYFVGYYCSVYSVFAFVDCDCDYFLAAFADQYLVELVALLPELAVASLLADFVVADSD